MRCAAALVGASISQPAVVFNGSGVDPRGDIARGRVEVTVVVATAPATSAAMDCLVGSRIADDSLALDI